MANTGSPTTKGWSLVGKSKTIVHKGKNRDTYDAAMSKDGQIFRSHENVLLLSGIPDQPYFAHILHFYLDDETNTVYMSVNWFYRADEAIISSKKKKVPMEEFDILYNSHEDDNPADSIIAAISLTCDPANMIGIEKEKREYDYLCRYEYLVSKNAKKLSIINLSDELKAQLLLYRTVNRATYEANLRVEEEASLKKKKKKQVEQKLQQKKKQKARRENEKKRKTEKVDLDFPVDTKKKKKAAMQKNQNIKITKRRITVSKKVKNSKAAEMSQQYGKRQKMLEDPYAKQREMQLKRDMERRQQLHLHVLQLPSEDNKALKRRQKLAMKLKKRLIEKERKKKEKEQMQAKAARHQQQRRTKSTSNLYSKHLTNNLTNSLKEMYPYGDAFTRHMPNDKPWGIKIDNDDEGRVYVADVRFEKSLNCASLKGVLVGDIITELNYIEFATPVHNLELFFTEVKKLRSQSKPIRVSFFRKNDSDGYSKLVNEIGFPKDMNSPYTDDVEYISLKDHITSNKKNNNYNVIDKFPYTLQTLQQKVLDFHNEGKADMYADTFVKHVGAVTETLERAKTGAQPDQSILENITNNLEVHTSDSSSSTTTSMNDENVEKILINDGVEKTKKTPRVGDEYQAVLPPFNSPSATLSVKSDSPLLHPFSARESIFDSFSSKITSVVIEKGSLVWVSFDSARSKNIEDAVNSNTLSNCGKVDGTSDGHHAQIKTKFAKRHKFFPAFLQTELVAPNIFVDFDESSFIEQNQLALEKVFDRPLNAIELDVLNNGADGNGAGSTKISVKTFDGVVLNNVVKIHGYVHKLFLHARLLCSPSQDVHIHKQDVNETRVDGFPTARIEFIMNSMGKKDPIGVLIKEYPSMRKKMIHIASLLSPFIRANRTYQHEEKTHQYLSTNSIALQGNGKSRYGRVRIQALPKQMQQEQAAIWSEAKKQKATLVADIHSEAEKNKLSVAATNMTSGFNRKNNNDEDMVVDPPSDMDGKDEENFTRPILRTKVVHRGDVGLNQYNLPTHVYGLNVNLACVTFPLGSEAKLLTSNMSHLRYKLSGKIPKAYDLICVRNREPAILLGSYGAKSIRYKHTIPFQKSQIVEVKDKVLVKFLMNDVDVDTELKYCDPILEPTPQHEALYEMYRLKLARGSDCFNGFISSLAETVKRLAHRFKSGQTVGDQHDEKQTTELQNAIIEFASKYPPFLQKFIKKFFANYKAEARDRAAMC